MSPQLNQFDVSQTRSISDMLVEAIFRRRLYETCSEILEQNSSKLSEEDWNLVQAGCATCERISSETLNVQTRLLRRLSDNGLSARPGFPLESSTGLQFHEFRLEIRGDQLGQVLEAAEIEGFAVDAVVKDKCRAIAAATNSLHLMAWDAQSTRVLLRWGSDRGKSAWRPTPADFAFAQLPDSLWPLYYAIRPLRVLADRLTGVRTADRLGLKSGSFSLGTPTALLAPLLEIMGIGSQDVIVDLGCGDGRVLVEAATRYGCESFGFERNLGLVNEARAAAYSQGVEDLVTVHHGNAVYVDATVVFLFLPVHLVPKMLDMVLKSAGPKLTAQLRSL